MRPDLSAVPYNVLFGDEEFGYDPKADIKALNDAARQIRQSESASAAPQLQPSSTTAGGGNELRPESWDEIVGQEKAKALLARMVETARARATALDHVLLVGPSGTGKTTLCHVIAHELGVQVWQLEAPVSADTLIALSTVMLPGDILFLDEVHQQAVADRRGRQSSTQPEILFSLLEDFTLPTPNGVIPFPRITVMGATTDEGALPDAFMNRFPIRPRLAHYTEEDMIEIAHRSAAKLGLRITPLAALTFARASRRVPREINNFLRNAAMLNATAVGPELASEVVHELNGYSHDGLTPDMMAMLKFLLTRGRRESRDGTVVYQSSVSTIATGIGKSRDVKAVQLRVEPWLIAAGYVQVLHGGRALTDHGIERALQLVQEEDHARHG